MKKFLAMVLALSLALTMIGTCALAEDVALKVWVGDNADIEWINGVIDAYKAAHADNNYTIDVNIVSEGDCKSTVLADPEAAADVFTFADDQFNDLYAAGALQQVTWSSSNTRAASFDGSTLNLHRTGTVTIKATANDGSKKTVSFKLVITD